MAKRHNVKLTKEQRENRPRCPHCSKLLPLHVFIHVQPENTTPVKLGDTCLHNSDLIVQAVSESWIVEPGEGWKHQGNNRHTRVWYGHVLDRYGRFCAPMCAVKWANKRITDDERIVGLLKQYGTPWKENA